MKKPQAPMPAIASPPGEAAWRRTATGLELHVRLTPRSASDKVEGVALLADGRQVLKARVRAVPEDGQANVALQRLLAAFFRRPASSVRLVAGATARIKTLVVAGDPDSLALQLVELEPPPP